MTYIKNVLIIFLFLLLFDMIFIQNSIKIPEDFQNICTSILPDEMPFVKRIIVIGDLHGDCENTKKIFEKFNLVKKINNNYQWIGNDTVVVQLGDQLDYGGRYNCNHINCPNDKSCEKELLNFLEKMNEEAEKYNGAIYSLIGNHELMNATGAKAYISPKGFKDFNGIQNRITETKPGSDFMINLACTRNSVLKIGDWLFVHGSILPYWANKYQIKEINEKIRNFLLGNIKIEDDDDLQRLITNSFKDSIFWNRDLGVPNVSSNTCSKVDEVFKMWNVNNLVIGHTVQNDINSACNNKIWRADIGLSSSFVNNHDLKVLEILNNNEGNLIEVKILE